MISSEGESVRVYVRVKPETVEESKSGLLVAEKNLDGVRNRVDLASRNLEKGCHSLLDLGSGSKGRTFFFDNIFGSEAGQKEVYEKAALPVVESVLQGFNGAIIAYGQTSSGKTYTMKGCRFSEVLFDSNNPNNSMYITENMGIIPRAINTVFNYVKDWENTVEFKIKVSVLEIYNEELRDLLGPAEESTRLRIREAKDKSIFIENMLERQVLTAKDLLNCLEMGQINRKCSETAMNALSSRSHLVFRLLIEQKNSSEKSAKAGKLYMVDLAGSEKVTKTKAKGETLIEAKKINSSLACLGNVINALAANSSKALRGNKPTYVSFRNSKLTRVLQEPLSRSTRTCLICTVSPSLMNMSETVSTLRFGQRASCIRNTFMANQVSSRENLEKEIEESKILIHKQNALLRKLLISMRESKIDVPIRSLDSNDFLFLKNNFNVSLDSFEGAEVSEEMFPQVTDRSSSKLLKNDSVPCSLSSKKTDSFSSISEETINGSSKSSDSEDLKRIVNKMITVEDTSEPPLKVAAETGIYAILLEERKRILQLNMNGNSFKETGREDYSALRRGPNLEVFSPTSVSTRANPVLLTDSPRNRFHWRESNTADFEAYSKKLGIRTKSCKPAKLQTGKQFKTGAEIFLKLKPLFSDLLSSQNFSNKGNKLAFNSL